MSLITIDENICTHCGGCVDECPVKIIAYKEEGSVPASIEQIESSCINCWHCVLVCPVDALEHSRVSPDSCPPLKNDLRISSEQAEQFLRSRRSIRKYSEKQVEKDILSSLVKTARYAPTGHNSQNLKWLVIYQKERLEKLEDMVIDRMRYMIKEMPEMAKNWNMDIIVPAHDDGIRTVCRGAPHLIIAYGLKADPTTQINSHIAMSYLELAAVPLKLGTCWAGFFNIASQHWPPLSKALELPENHAVCSAMMIGYPVHTYNRLVPRNEPEITFA
jgi:nitroreductase/NAD-dependent dihydropyrimidine dehydrogenase PreA subunit